MLLDSVYLVGMLGFTNYLRPLPARPKTKLTQSLFYAQKT